MAFGIPGTSDLNGLADKLGAIVASVGPEEQAVLTSAIDQLSEHVEALESKTAVDLSGAGSALVDQLLKGIATERAAICSEVDRRLNKLNGLTLTLRLQFPDAPG